MAATHTVSLLKKHTLLIILFGALLLPANIQAKTIRFGMTPWIANYPLNVAYKLGFFEQEGLDLEIVNFNTDQEMRDAIKFRRVDLALDMLGSFVGYSQDGIPITILAQTDWSFGGDKIILRKGIFPNKLKGKMIGVYQNRPSVTYFLDHWLRSHGLGLKDVRLVELNAEDTTKNFLAGRFAAMVNFDPHIQVALKNGFGFVSSSTANYPGIMPEGIGGHSQSINNLKPSELHSIFKAWKRALIWAKNPKNKEHFLDIVKRHIFKNEIALNNKSFSQMLSRVKVHPEDVLLKVNSPGGQTDQFLNAIRNFLHRNKILKADFSSRTLFNATSASRYLK